MNVVLKLLGGCGFIGNSCLRNSSFTFTRYLLRRLGNRSMACSDLALTLQQMLPLMPLA